MTTTIKHLSTGYWHARDTNRVHMYAQFQNFPCTREDVVYPSHYYPSTVNDFVYEINLLEKKP